MVSSYLVPTRTYAGRPGVYERQNDPVGQYPRLGACPDEHACIFPPDVTQFLPGAYFDLRVELHAYDKNTNHPAPAPFQHFETTIRREDGPWMDVNDFFGIVENKQPALEYWNFTWADSAQVFYAEPLGTNKKPIDVNVSSRVWRKLKFDEPGTYDVSVRYSPTEAYTVRYSVVQPRKPKRKAKNAILFIADGCNIGMITAARAIARKHTSGKFVEGLLTFEDFDNLGHIITHSIDGLVTDSCNSASAYATGQKTSIKALGAYVDSSKSHFDNPKMEQITELIRRRQPGKSIGIVTTANVQDATPAAFYAHSRTKKVPEAITDQIVHGVPQWVLGDNQGVAPDVLMGGGAEYFKGEKSLNGTDYYALLRDKYQYQVVMDKHQLKDYHDQDKLLGIFRTGLLDVWLERNVYVNNTVNNGAAPDLSGADASGSDQPGLDDMTLKALEVLKKRGGEDGFFLMAEAAAVDKRLHNLDFPRAYAELIEMDMTIKKTIEWLKNNGEYEDTLILFTADHSHAFDVFGTVDQNLMDSQSSSKDMRYAVGVYERSGWPGYINQDPYGFPDNWDPRIALAGGSNNGPDHFEAWKLSDRPREATILQDEDNEMVSYANKADKAGGYGKGLLWNGNVPVKYDTEVHSMADVAIYSNGPGSDLFKKTIENWSVFFKMTEALGLQEYPTATDNNNSEKKL
ncbi:alkaline-phosphatase-like protein [Phascolomyces articulosus]|uniref:alkaline phosphatase n=1 Tax=Phascolomyces articulosus TaxID=60185 RepID=A0AAD5PEK2_9FUNG|nr:alkaline-phosphatase-like protein [Phascolomyces articulosus]